MKYLLALLLLLPLNAWAVATPTNCPTLGGTQALNYSTSTNAYSCNAITAGSGTVTTTGTPLIGQLAIFSGSTSITNGNLSGDVTTSGSLATTLATVNSNVGSFTNASITVNAKGLITAASSGAGSGVSSFTGDGALLSNSASTGAVTATLGNAAAKSLWGNASASSGAPGYQTSPVVSGSVTANTLVSTVATGTPPFTIASTTNVGNLNASLLNGATFAAPGTIGGVTPGAATFTTINATSLTTTNGVALSNLAQSGANTMLGNWTGSTANVTANTLPSCADTGGNHLNYVNGTGITCGTSGGGGGVTSFSGDGTLISNSASTGAVTATLANATAKSLLGNSGATGATPTYQTSPVLSGSVTASGFIPTGSAVVTNGMYLPSTNKIAFSTNTIDGFEIDSAQQSTFFGGVSARKFQVNSSDTPTNGLNLSATNTVGIYTNSLKAVDVLPAASAVNNLTLSGSATGSGPTIGVAGTDTNIDAVVTPKGIGQVNMNGTKLWSANMDMTKIPNLRGCIANWTSHASGAGQNCLIFFKGTSLTAGSLSAAQDAVTQAPPSQFAAWLNDQGIAASANSWLGGWNATVPRTTYDKRLIKGTDWALNGTGLTSAGGTPYTATSGGTAPLAFTPGWVSNAGTLNKVLVDTCKVLYVQFPITSSFKWDFDGGSATTINANGTDALGITTATTTLGVHTLNLNWVSGTATIIGSYCYNSAYPQVIVLNGGWPGAQALDWAATNETGSNDPWAPGNFTNSFGSLMNWIELGANEEINSTNTGTFATNLATVITQSQNSGNADAIIQSYNWFTTATYNNHLPYVQTIRTAAGTTIPYVGVSEAFVSYAAETATNTNYINTSDGFGGVHLNPAGQHAEAEIWKAALAPMWNFSGSSNAVSGDNTGNKFVLGDLLVGSSVKPSAVIASGTKFTTSGAGCTVASTLGGAFAGQFTANTTGTCTTTVTMGGVTAPNGWSCWARDRTVPATGGTTASTTTTATIVVATTSGNTVDFGCLGY